MSLLELKNIFAGYNSKNVLKGVSFSADKGEFIAMLGPNGCGKTTLLRSIAKIMPIFSGEISVNNKNISKISRNEIARQMAFVPQISEAIEGFSVEEMVFMGRNPYVGAFSQSSRHDAQVVEKALRQTNLLQYRERDISTLSGGEYQRVIIARALAQESDIILLDEPTAHLDIKYQIEIMRLIKCLVVGAYHDMPLLVIATFHDLRLAEKYCERIILIKDGHIAADGRKEDVLTPQMIKRVYEVDAE